MAREDLLVRTFVEVADTLVDDFDLVDVAQRLVERCVELFDAVAVGLLMAGPDGILRVLASSDHGTDIVELFEVQAHEGPCADCYRSASPVVNDDLAVVNGRWPSFAPVAVQAGYRSVHAFPVRLRRQAIGALGLLRSDAGPLDDADITVAQALADALAIAVLQQRALQDAQLLSLQLETALTTRVRIEQAKGMLAERAKITTADAFIRIRNYSRSHNQQLIDVCDAILQGSLDAKELTTPTHSEPQTPRSTR